MKKPTQVIVLSPVKFTCELLKKLLEREEIKTLALLDYQDFAHFLNDLHAQMLLVDLKFAQEQEFETKLKQEIGKAEVLPQLVFLGTEDEWQKTTWAKDLGDFLQAPVDIKEVVFKIQEIFTSKMS